MIEERQRFLKIVSQSYSTIRIDQLSAILGLPIEECHGIIKHCGWVLDDASQVVIIGNRPIEANGVASGIITLPPITSVANRQLSNLSNYVGFVENSVY